ncbi:hypothetical protein BIKONL_003224 [Pseudomonas putida]
MVVLEGLGQANGLVKRLHRCCLYGPTARKPYITPVQERACPRRGPYRQPINQPCNVAMSITNRYFTSPAIIRS